MAFSFFSKKTAGGDVAQNDQGQQALRGVPTQGPHVAPMLEEDFFGDDGLVISGDQIDNLQVTEDFGETLHPQIEAAIMRYVSGDVPGTIATLEKACTNTDMGAAIEAVWMMRFELLQQQGKRSEFEDAALGFAMQFGRSPPLWPVDVVEPVLPGQPQVVALTGVLNADIGKQLQPVFEKGMTGPVCLDVSGINAVESAGCSLLVRSLMRLREARRVVVIQHADHLLKQVEVGAQAGLAERREYWLLSLDLLQQCGDEQRFEGLAVDYAVTFEVSPPSWEPPPATSFPTVVPQVQQAVGPQLKGDMLGANSELTSLENYLVECDGVLCADFSQVRRVDLAAATALFNALLKLTSRGKPVRLQKLSYLVAPVLQTVGVPQLATLELRTV